MPLLSSAGHGAPPCQAWRIRFWLPKGSPLPAVWISPSLTACPASRSSFRPSSGLLLAVWGRCLVAMSCPTLCDPTDYNPPGSSVHGISQASIQEWVAISFSRGSSQPRDWELLHGQVSSLWLSHQGSPSQGSPTPQIILLLCHSFYSYAISL